MELVQPILVAAQGQPGQELLDSGIPRPDREKIRFPCSSRMQASAIRSAHSSMRYSVAGDEVAGMVMSSMKWGQHRLLGQMLPRED